MASRRILNSISRHSLLVSLLSVMVISGLLISSCGTAREVSKEPETSGPKADEEKAEELSEEFIALLNDNRSELSDVYSSQQNEIPELFMSESEAPDIDDPYQGYRIQILTTREVARADSVANDFRFWADSVMTSFVPKAYVLFRQPYYKVHVGNFHFRERAMKLNQFIKDRYPDAWVVHDEVEPNLVPPDTVIYNQEQDNEREAVQKNQHL